MAKLFSAFGGFLRRAFGSLASQAVKEIKNALTEELMQIATTLVRQADLKFDTNLDRREWAVMRLIAGGVNEGDARIAVEGALKVIQAQMQQKLPAKAA